MIYLNISQYNDLQNMLVKEYMKVAKFYYYEGIELDDVEGYAHEFANRIMKQSFRLSNESS